MNVTEEPRIGDADTGVGDGVPCVAEPGKGVPSVGVPCSISPASGVPGVYGMESSMVNGSELAQGSPSCSAHFHCPTSSKTMSRETVMHPVLGL
jgi:hypothetical protein